MGWRYAFVHLFARGITQDQQLLRYRGNMANFNHFTCCDYRIHKGCMIHSWYMFHKLARETAGGEKCELQCDCGTFQWKMNSEKTVERKFVELLKQYLYPWIDVAFVSACYMYQYDLKEIVCGRENADFCVINTLVTLSSSKVLSRDKHVNMQLFVDKRDCYHTESVFLRVVVFNHLKYETHFRYEGVLGQVDIQLLHVSPTRYRIIRMNLGVKLHQEFH